MCEEWRCVVVVGVGWYGVTVGGSYLGEGLVVFFLNNVVLVPLLLLLLLVPLLLLLLLLVVANEERMPQAFSLRRKFLMQGPLEFV